MAMIFAVTAIGCPDPKTEVIYPCPGDTDDAILGADGECRCENEDEVFVAGSLTCSHCESQDAQGRYCDCGGRAFLDMEIFGDFAACESPPTCSPGTWWNGFTCAQCGLNQCGGSCGGCFIGSQCINSVCTNLWECCIAGSSDRCYFEDPLYAPIPGLGCFCIDYFTAFVRQGSVCGVY